MIAMSMTCPWPVMSRWRSAIMIADDVARAVIPSARPNGGRVGGPSAGPVIAAKPLIDSARVPKPGRRRYGPVWPKPVTRAITSRGLRACSGSGPMLQFSSVPGRKFSMRTSAWATRSSRIAWASGCERFSVIVRLLRPIIFHHRLTPFFR